MNELKITYLPTGDLIPYARNSRTHTDEQVAQVAASIREFGFASPVLIGEDKTIIAGHCRVMAAQKLGLETVPTITATGWSEAQKRAYVIVDNRLAENAGWDAEMLKTEFADLDELGFDLSLLGFDDSEMADLLADDETTEPMTDPDEIPEPEETPVTRTGDIWTLGNHRLMCGDSTNGADVTLLMDGERASVLVFDPPYEMPELYDFIPRNDSGGGALICFSDHKHFAEPVTAAIRAGWTPRFEFVWDCVQSWYTPNRPLARHKTCTVYGDREHWNFDAAIINDGKHREAHTVRNTRGECDYVPLDGAVHMRTLEALPNTAQNDENGHGKPVAWIAAILNGYTPPRCIVADMFCGSGAFIVACENTGRVCYGMEIDPRFCDVIIHRWQNLTGKQATMDGKTYDQLREERNGASST